MFEYQVFDEVMEEAAPVGDRAVEVVRSTASSDEWDEFAKACDASFRCSYAGTHLWQLEHHVFSKVERLEFYLKIGPCPIKIAQCAIGIGRAASVFSDTLQILPAFDVFFSDCLSAALELLGPGQYQYGSEWTIAPCRAATVSAISGISALQSRFVEVQAIEFSQWRDFASYYQSVSTNARRNVKKAEKAYDALTFSDQSGSGVLMDVVPLQVLRHKLFLRKGVRSSLAGLILRSTLRTIATSRYSVSVSLAHRAQTLARYLGINFGRNVFYMESAAEQDHPYAASFLLKEMIRRGFEASNGRGHFIMGPDDHQQRGTPAWDGLVRSRQQWNAVGRPTSVLTFAYGD